MTNTTYTPNFIRECAPKTTAGRQAARWLVAKLEDNGAARFNRLVVRNMATPPTEYDTAFSKAVYAILCRITDRNRQARAARSAAEVSA